MNCHHRYVHFKSLMENNMKDKKNKQLKFILCYPWAIEAFVRSFLCFFSVLANVSHKKKKKKKQKNSYKWLYPSIVNTTYVYNDNLCCLDSGMSIQHGCISRYLTSHFLKFRIQTQCNHHQPQLIRVLRMRSLTLISHK